MPGSELFFYYFNSNLLGRFSFTDKMSQKNVLTQTESDVHENDAKLMQY